MQTNKPMQNQTAGPLLSLVTVFFSFPLVKPSMEPSRAFLSLPAGGGSWPLGGAEGGAAATHKHNNNKKASKA